MAEACNGREAAEKAKLLQPDVTILDLSMPELNRLDAAREILKCISTKVLILTMYYSDRLMSAPLFRYFGFDSRLLSETASAHRAAVLSLNCVWF